MSAWNEENLKPFRDDSSWDECFLQSVIINKQNAQLYFTRLLVQIPHNPCFNWLKFNQLNVNKLNIKESDQGQAGKINQPGIALAALISIIKLSVVKCSVRWLTWI